MHKRLQSGTTAAGRTVPPAPKGALPVVTFNDRATAHANGGDIRAVHVPSGHTDGDSVIEFMPSRVIHMGDDFFKASPMRLRILSTAAIIPANARRPALSDSGPWPGITFTALAVRHIC
jgi:glyoxylase-like metal-dependent hydrolase (beta-lactamase superfamily II)